MAPYFLGGLTPQLGGAGRRRKPKKSDQYPLVPNDESNKPKKEPGDGCIWWAIAIILLIALFSPIDPIPDVIPVAGWLDDVGYIGGLLYIPIECTAIAKLCYPVSYEYPAFPGIPAKKRSTLRNMKVLRSSRQQVYSEMRLP